MALSPTPGPVKPRLAMIRLATFLLLFLLLPWLAAATSPTLTLEAVFARPEAPWSPPRDWSVADSAGPPFEAPTAEVFRVKPTATPSPIGTPAEELQPASEVDQMMGEIQRIPSRIESGRKVTRKITRPLLTRKGRILASNPRGAAIEVQNGFREVCVRLTFEPEGGGPPLILLLAPETGDQFDLPPGRYRVIREAWTSNGEGLVREEFPTQPLEASWRYVIEQTPADERQLIRQGGQSFT